jgi:hypothetical protein
MFDAPMDGLVIWIALTVVSGAAAGVALGLPTTAPPDAGAVADAVDRVATSSFDVRTTVPVEADEIRLNGQQLSLRSEGQVSHAAFAAGPVVPVGGTLSVVLRGKRPKAVFRSKRAFVAALERHRAGSGTWQMAPARLGVRRVTWGNVDATLVG